MLLKTKRKIIYALLSVLLFSVSLFCVTNVNNLNIAKAAIVIDEPKMTEIKGIPGNAIKVVDSERNSDGEIVSEKRTGRYLYFKNSGSVMVLVDVPDTDNDPNVENPNRIYIFQESLSVYFNGAVFTKSVEVGKFYSLDLNNLKTTGHEWYISVYGIEGEFYTSYEDEEAWAGMTEIEAIPSNAVPVVNSEYDSGNVGITKASFTGRYVYFHNDGINKSFSYAGREGIDVCEGCDVTVKDGTRSQVFGIVSGRYYCIDLMGTTPLNSSRNAETEYFTVCHLIGNFYTSNDAPIFNVTVSLDMNGHGRQYSPVTVESGETIPENSDLRSIIPESDDGYWFTGWYDEDDKVFDFNTPITKNTVLHAVWIESPFTAKYVSELPANARKVKVGDVITNQKLYFVATDNGHTDISFNSEFSENIPYIGGLRLHSFIGDYYTDLLWTSFSAHKQYGTQLANPYSFGCLSILSGKEITEVQYNSYYLGEITEIANEDKLNLYILDPDNSDINTPTNESDTKDNLLTVLKMGVTFATAAAAIFVGLRFIEKKKEK